MRRAKELLLLFGSLAAIIASALWIYFTEFAGSSFNVPLHQWLGEMLAQATARLVHTQGQVVVVTMTPASNPD
jgi:hypothetical protein